MSVMTTIAKPVAVPFARAAFALVGAAALGIRQLARAYSNRRDAAALARLDDRMLADIGLTRSDVRDAFAEPLWHDPTNLLRARALERRLSRPRIVLAPEGGHISAPPLAPQDEFPRPTSDKSARFPV